MGDIASVLYGVETLVEGGIALAKGVYDPTLPLKARLVPITDLDLPRAYHSVSVIKGRAYIFGGKVGDAELADNAVQVIILPSSGIESTDYQELDPTPSSPSPRYGHSSAVIDNQIYIFGGSDLNGPIDEGGRVWAFDTSTNTWSSLDPKTVDTPGGRTWAAMTATTQPKPDHHRTDENVAPQMPPDPAKMVPEPIGANTYGTLIVYGGVSSASKKSDAKTWAFIAEIWAFDISSKTWYTLASPPLPTSPVQSPSITMVGKRLYAVTGNQTHYLDLDKNKGFGEKRETNDAHLSPLSPWTKVKANSESKKAIPDERSAAALVPVTTGQGRNFLLLIGGESISKADAASSQQQQHDIWALQLKSESRTAASIKDALRHKIRKSTAEEEWAEVRYYNSEDRIVQEGQMGRGIGERRGFAACRGAEIDGGTVLVWGGIEEGKVRGDGVLIEIEK